MEKLKMVILGAGNRSRTWKRGFDEFPGFEVVALADPDGQALKATGELYGVPPERWFASVEDALDTVEADCVIVISPSGAHADNCRAALARGLHVACEKPFVENLQDAREIMEIGRDKGLIVSVTQSARLESLHEHVAELLRQGTIGDVGYMVEHYYRNRLNVRPYSLEQEWPHLHQIAVHDFDRYRFWFGCDIESVSIKALDPSWSPYKYPAVTLGRLRMQNGVWIHYFASFVSKICSFRTHCAIEGSTGQLRSDYPGRSLFLSRPDFEEDQDITASVPSGEMSCDGKFLKRFYESIVQGAGVFCPPEDNLKTLAAIEAAVISARQDGAVVNVRGVLEGALGS